MKYKIFIDLKFKKDFKSVYDYISHKLKVKNAANDLRICMKNCILNIGTISETYAQLDNLKVSNKPLRFCIYKNFYILFSVSDKNVYVYNFVYSKSEKYKNKYRVNES